MLCYVANMPIPVSKAKRAVKPVETVETAPKSLFEADVRVEEKPTEPLPAPRPVEAAAPEPKPIRVPEPAKPVEPILREPKPVEVPTRAVKPAKPEPAPEPKTSAEPVPAAEPPSPPKRAGYIFTVEDAEELVDRLFEDRVRGENRAGKVLADFAESRNVSMEDFIKDAARQNFNLPQVLMEVNKRPQGLSLAQKAIGVIDEDRAAAVAKEYADIAKRSMRSSGRWPQVSAAETPSEGLRTREQEQQRLLEQGRREVASIEDLSTLSVKASDKRAGILESGEEGVFEEGDVREDPEVAQPGQSAYKYAESVYRMVPEERRKILLNEFQHVSSDKTSAVRKIQQHIRDNEWLTIEYGGKKWDVRGGSPRDYLASNPRLAKTISEMPERLQVEARDEIESLMDQAAFSRTFNEVAAARTVGAVPQRVYLGVDPTEFSTVGLTPGDEMPARSRPEMIERLVDNGRYADALMLSLAPTIEIIGFTGGRDEDTKGQGREILLRKQTRVSTAMDDLDIVAAMLIEYADRGLVYGMGYDLMERSDNPAELATNAKKLAKDFFSSGLSRQARRENLMTAAAESPEMRKFFEKAVVMAPALDAAGVKAPFGADSWSEIAGDVGPIATGFVASVGVPDPFDAVRLAKYGPDAVRSFQQAAKSGAVGRAVGQYTPLRTATTQFDEAVVGANGAAAKLEKAVEAGDPTLADDLGALEARLRTGESSRKKKGEFGEDLRAPVIASAPFVRAVDMVAAAKVNKMVGEADEVPALADLDTMRNLPELSEGSYLGATGKKLEVADRKAGYTEASDELAARQELQSAGAMVDPSITRALPGRAMEKEHRHVYDFATKSRNLDRMQEMLDGNYVYSQKVADAYRQRVEKMLTDAGVPEKAAKRTAERAGAVLKDSLDESGDLGAASVLDKRLSDQLQKASDMPKVSEATRAAYAIAANSLRNAADLVKSLTDVNEQAKVAGKAAVARARESLLQSMRVRAEAYREVHDELLKEGDLGRVLERYQIVRPRGSEPPRGQGATDTTPSAQGVPAEKIAEPEVTEEVVPVKPVPPDPTSPVSVLREADSAAAAARDSRKGRGVGVLGDAVVLTPMPRDAVFGKTLEEVATYIRDHAPSADYRVIAGKVADTISEMGANTVKGPDGTEMLVTFDVVRQKPGRGLGRQTARVRRTGSGTVEIRYAVEITGEPTYGVMLHELIHVVTRHQIEAGLREGADPRLRRTVGEINALRNLVVDHINRANAIATTKGRVVDLDAAWYGATRGNTLHDEREFVAWALTDRHFQDYLRTIKVDKTDTVWSKFVAKVRDLLGIPAESSDALSATLQATEDLMRMPRETLVDQAKVWAGGEPTPKAFRSRNLVPYPQSSFRLSDEQRANMDARSAFVDAMRRASGGADEFSDLEAGMFSPEDYLPGRSPADTGSRDWVYADVGDVTGVPDVSRPTVRDVAGRGETVPLRAIDWLSKQAEASGVPFDAEDTLRRLRAGETVELPFSIRGQTRFSDDDLLDLQMDLDRIRTVGGQAKLSVPLKSSRGFVEEESTSQAVLSMASDRGIVRPGFLSDDDKNTFVRGVKAFANAFGTTVWDAVGKRLPQLIIGGDEDAALRMMPPRLREIYRQQERMIVQRVGDINNLLTETEPGSWDRVIDYLAGTRMRFAKSGRPVSTSGHDALSEIGGAVRREYEVLRGEVVKIDDVTAEDLDIDKSLAYLDKRGRPTGDVNEAITYGDLIDEVGATIMSRMETSGGRTRAAKAVGSSADIVDPEAAKAYSNRRALLIAKLTGQGASPFFENLAATMFDGQKLASQTEGSLDQYVYAMLKLAGGQVGKDATGKFVIEFVDKSSVNLGRDFFRAIEDLPSNEAKARVAALIGAYGYQTTATNKLIDLGATLTGPELELLRKISNSQHLTADEYTEALTLLRTFGVSTDGLKESQQILMKSAGQGDRYLPDAAERMLNQALGLAVDREVRAAMKYGDKPPMGMAALRVLIQINQLIKNHWVRGVMFPKARMVFLDITEGSHHLGVYTGDTGTTMRYFLRAAPQGITMVPGFDLSRRSAQYGARMIAGGMAGLLAESNALRKAGEPPLRDFSRLKIEDIREAIAAGTDGVIRALFGLSFDLRANQILRGDSGVFETADGRRYRIEDFRKAAIESSVLQSFASTELGPVTRRQHGRLPSGPTDAVRHPLATGKWLVHDVAGGYTDSVSELAEGFSERARLGGMLAIAEAGADPYEAGRILRQALFDFPGSVADSERISSVTGFAINLLHPFWTYQKNINRRMVDAVADPVVGWRFKASMKAFEKGDDAFNDVVYNVMFDPYGFDTSSMTDDERRLYTFFRDRWEDNMGRTGNEQTPFERAMFASMLVNTQEASSMSPEVWRRPLAVPQEMVAEADRMMGGMLQEYIDMSYPDAVTKETRDARSREAGLLAEGLKQRYSKRATTALQKDYERDQINLSIPARRNDAFNEWVRTTGKADAVYQVSMTPPGIYDAFNYTSGMAMVIPEMVNYILAPEPATMEGMGEVLETTLPLDPLRSPLTNEVMIVLRGGQSVRLPRNAGRFFKSMHSPLVSSLVTKGGGVDPGQTEAEQVAGVGGDAGAVVSEDYYVAPPLMAALIRNVPYVAEPFRLARMFDQDRLFGAEGQMPGAVPVGLELTGVGKMGVRSREDVKRDATYQTRGQTRPLNE